MSEQNEKEVIMDVKEGGRRSRKGRRRGQTKKSGRGEDDFDDANDKTPYVTKEDAVKTNTVLKPGPPVVAHAVAKTQSGGAPQAPHAPQAPQAPQPKVVLAPAKQKPAKVMLVPKRSGSILRSVIQKKTFKAKQVAVTIDNTAKTQKRRKAAMAQIDAMTEDQVRAAAVGARLSRRETVAKAPIGLLRQMVKDYRSLRGLL